VSIDGVSPFQVVQATWNLLERSAGAALTVHSVSPCRNEPDMLERPHQLPVPQDEWCLERHRGIPVKRNKSRREVAGRS
jgi:hypothetical protein